MNGLSRFCAYPYKVASILIIVNMSDDTPLETRLIETWFPTVAISRLVEADRRARDPVYGIHRWFARRPPTLVRALLLASHLNATTSESEFWRMHGTPGNWLENAIVYDPFMGGGTSLVESARMGAHVMGRDVDPISVAIVQSELCGPDNEFAQASASLLDWLSRQFHSLFVNADPEWTPLHWFWLTRPICPTCNHRGLLYRDLIIASSSGKHGSVVRDEARHVFCPECLAIHVVELECEEFHCCGENRKIAQSTFHHGRYHCPDCGARSTHEDLQTGCAEKVLIAVEETHLTKHRRIRSANSADRSLVTQAGFLSNGYYSDLDIPLESCRIDGRPVSAGYSSSRSLFTDRQWIVFTTAFDAIRRGNYSPALERDLTLMFSSSLTSNNILCSYARDWGRLAPLFSVRGFSIPALMVELNPFHSTAGRGTFRSARARILSSGKSQVKRAILSANGISRSVINLPLNPASVTVECKSATDAVPDSTLKGTICVTDPPYFDYIAYSELSEFFRVWLPNPNLSGVPILPNPHDPIMSFATNLGEALKITVANLDSTVPLVFTYHSSNRCAWDALGIAFDFAELSVVNLWPVLADPHMGHHALERNCEWDLVLVARRNNEVEKIDSTQWCNLPTMWLRDIEAARFIVGSGDRASFENAWAMARNRLARYITKQTVNNK